MWKGAADSKKAKRPSKEEIKKQLLESIIIDQVVEFEDLNKKPKKYVNLKKQERQLNGMKISLK